MPSLRFHTDIHLTSISRGAHVKRNVIADTASGTHSALVWIIVAAVAALLALASCIALIIISLSKRRLLKKQLDEARQRDPCLGQREFSRRRRLTVKDQALEAEEQREAMLRKSLASRPSRSPSMFSHLTFDLASMTERSRAGSFEHSTLRLEKELETGMRFSRPSSIASLERTRSTSPFPEFPRPTLSRSSSFSRFHLHEMRPPPLEQHPCLRSERSFLTIPSSGK